MNALTATQIQARAQQIRRSSSLARAASGGGVGQSALEWAVSNATIVHPVRGRVPFHPYPYQAAFLSCPALRRIRLKARQIGFSQAIALEALYKAIVQDGRLILLVSRSQDLAVNLLRYCYLTYNNLKEAPPLVKENESEMGFANGSRIKSIPANRSTGRGFAASDVYLDEFAYADYADDIYQSVSPTVSQGGTLTIASTPNGADNLFHSLFHAGVDFDRAAVPWWECPAYWTEAEREGGIPKESGAWYKREHPRYTTQAWAAEYECSFEGSGLGMFDIMAIGQATEGADGERPAHPGHTYLTSVDVGRRRDATVINTFDTTHEPYQRAAFERLERVPYPLIQQRIADRARAYPGPVWIESNGVGDPLIENMEVPVHPFWTTARSKVQAIQALQLLLEQGRLKATWEARERAALVAASWNDDHTADEVMSLAIGAYQLLNSSDGVYL